jgi:catechol 2,3-dioxygenase-like lactoylglutathione lyase family enzyme
MSQVGVRQLVPLLMVKSMDASLRFYVDGLGFTITNQWTPQGRIRWCWLEHGTAALMLQEWATDDSRRSELEGKLGAGVGLNFTCADALAFFHVVRERGLPVMQPFVGNRMWVASLLDPDGYSLHFESPTDTPEESVYEG